MFSVLTQASNMYIIYTYVDILFDNNNVTKRKHRVLRNTGCRPENCFKRRHFDSIIIYIFAHRKSIMGKLFWNFNYFNLLSNKQLFKLFTIMFTVDILY